MTGWQIFWLCVCIWSGLGLTGFAYFRYWIRTTFKNIDTNADDDHGLIAIEFITAVIVGPINWAAICIVIDTYNEDLDD